MALTGDVTVIELDGPSLTALWARVSADAVVVNRWVSAVRPEEVAADRPEQVGAWLGKALRDADLPRRRVVMAVSRGDVILKQLVLPVAEGGGGLSDAELASIVVVCADAGGGDTRVTVILLSLEALGAVS